MNEKRKPKELLVVIVNPNSQKEVPGIMKRTERDENCDRHKKKSRHNEPEEELLNDKGELTKDWASGVDRIWKSMENDTKRFRRFVKKYAGNYDIMFETAACVEGEDGFLEILEEETTDDVWKLTLEEGGEGVTAVGLLVFMNSGDKDLIHRYLRRSMRVNQREMVMKAIEQYLQELELEEGDFQDIFKALKEEGIKMKVSYSCT